MRVLILTAMWPTQDNPAFGSFVRSQVECLRQAGIQLDVLVMQGRFRKLMYPRAIFELRQRLAENPADLVHAHYGLVGMVARSQWQVPVVVTFHGSDVLGGIDREGKTSFLSRAIAWGGRALSHVVDAVIVQSAEMARKFSTDNVHIIPHEVDLQTFSPTERDAARRTLGLAPDKKYILFAANPATAVKRFPLAREAVARLKSQDPSAELLVVFKETQPRLALYMSASDALVFPSFQEGSPNIVKQAMACNLPIVATEVGDVRDVIGGTDGCYICEPSAREFAEKLSKLLESPMRTRGREHVRHFAPPRVAKRLIRVYEDTLRQRAELPNAKTEKVT
jgi:glycosyltransferase involved in cell wall biosynthesis